MNLKDAKAHDPLWGGARIGPSAAILGAVLLLVGTYLHPSQADPNVPLAAFTEYAADHTWIASHLMQLFGVVLMAAALVLVTRRMMDGPAADWAVCGMAGAIASMALTAALQAVDGVALKVMVNTWAMTPEPGKAAIFQAAFGVRQIEIGLAGLTSMLLGLTITIYGVAFLIDRRFARWIGTLAIVGGAPTAVAGVVITETGFSDLAMIINMVAGSLLILWMAALGIYAWRRSPAPTPALGPRNLAIPASQSEI
ncbi:MAG TPA: hypothetical protein VKY74_27705 [Chloroflexia bacterium]|nr:hypothetical protein [Chloroflexia bacterium]